ncbi:energy transducer TonB [bacterium]|nr:energy transducer TonB [bacterium]
MKILTPKRLSYSALLILVNFGLSNISSAVENFESLEVIHSVLPAYPTGITFEGIFDGSAQVVVNVNELGEVEDVYLASYTHSLFGQFAAEYIQKWKFKPAKLNGEPLSVIKPFDFEFEDRRGVFAMGIREAAASKLRFSNFVNEKRIYSPIELDGIPEPISMKQPYYPEEFKGQGVKGSATVLFYIDEEGNIRMPHVTEYSHENFGKRSADRSE